MQRAPKAPLRLPKNMALKKDYVKMELTRSLKRDAEIQMSRGWGFQLGASGSVEGLNLKSHQVQIKLHLCY